jgi:hypothetical protein
VKECKEHRQQDIEHCQTRIDWLREVEMVLKVEQVDCEAGLG